MSKNKESNENLKGTLYLCLALGVIIVGVWAACFTLFMDRF